MFYRHLFVDLLNVIAYLIYGVVDKKKNKVKTSHEILLVTTYTFGKIRKFYKNNSIVDCTQECVVKELKLFII